MQAATPPAATRVECGTCESLSSSARRIESRRPPASPAPPGGGSAAASAALIAGGFRDAEAGAGVGAVAATPACDTSAAC